MGSFGGTFAPWSESKGLRVFSEPVFVWVKISELPYHLWDQDFLAILFKDVGEIHALSRDILAKEEAKDCKALIKVKCRQDIPSSIPFRYLSPTSNWMMEGKAVIKPMGKSASAQQLQMDSALLFYEREGEPSSNNNLEPVRRNFGAESVVNQTLIRPNREDSTRVLPHDKIPPPISSPQPGSKGKEVIQDKSNREESENLPYGLLADGHSPAGQGPSNFVSPAPHNTNKVEIMCEGSRFLMDRNVWASVCFSALEPMGHSRVGPLVGPNCHQAAPGEIPNPISSSRQSVDSSASLAPSPGFERDIKRRRRPASRSIPHRPLQRYLLAFSRGYSSGNKKGQSSSSTSSCPINSINHDSLINIATNCGIKELISVEGLSKLKRLELDRRDGAN